MYLLSTGSQKQDSIIQNTRLKCVSDLLSINEKNKNLVIFWFLSLCILFFDSRHLSNIYLILHYSQKKSSISDVWQGSMNASLIHDYDLFDLGYFLIYILLKDIC